MQFLSFSLPHIHKKNMLSKIFVLHWFRLAKWNVLQITMNVWYCIPCCWVRYFCFISPTVSMTSVSSNFVIRSEQVGQFGIMEIQSKIWHLFPTLHLWNRLFYLSMFCKTFRHIQLLWRILIIDDRRAGMNNKNLKLKTREAKTELLTDKRA